MALLDIFKKKEEKAPVKKQSPAKSKSLEKKAAPVVAKPETPRQKQPKSGFIYGIVKKPHISEKATNLGQINQYVFEVYQKSNKIEVKKAIENIYGVDVLRVNIIKIPGKTMRMGRTEGFKSGYKKAVVTIKEGQKIEIL